MKLFGNKTVEKRVMAVVGAAIERAQKKHDEEVARAEAELVEAHDALDAKHEERLVGIADDSVRDVFATLR